MIYYADLMLSTNDMSYINSLVDFKFNSNIEVHHMFIHQWIYIICHQCIT